MRIGLFVTCLTDTLFPDTGKAVVTVLEPGRGFHDPGGSSTRCGTRSFMIMKFRHGSERSP